MKERPLFSVVIPVYGVEAYLDRCIRSVQSQNPERMEILMVDDGSPDACPGMCEAYAAEDSRIRVIHQENQGLSGARNTGLRYASGEYVLFVDSDDYLEPGALKHLVPFTKNSPDIIVGEGVCEGGSYAMRHRAAPDQCSGPAFLKAAIRGNAMPMAAWLYVYRRDFLRQKGLAFRERSTHEDEDFTPRAFLAAERVVNSRVLLYHYVIRAGSITGRKDLRNNARDFYRISMDLEKLYRSLEDRQLGCLLTDTLAVKYLSLFQAGMLHRYGEDLLHRADVLRWAKRPKTRAKAMVYRISPGLYWRINRISKTILKKGKTEGKA